MVTFSALFDPEHRLLKCDIRKSPSINNTIVVIGDSFFDYYLILKSENQEILKIDFQKGDETESFLFAFLIKGKNQDVLNLILE